MFVIPAIAVLFTFVYWRPHEIFEGLRWLNINLVLGLAAFAYVLDLGLGITRPRPSPLVALAVAFFTVCLGSVAVHAPEVITEQAALLGISGIAFLLISQGLQSLRAIGAASTVLLTFTLVLSAVGVEQRLSPTVCYVPGLGPGGADLADGRPCTNRESCREGGNPDIDYLCEHPGLLGTHSIAGRVRFRGILEDPNELSWAISMGTPLAFAFFERRRSLARLLILAGILVVGAICVIATQSRSGQLAMVAVFAIYFVRRFGWRGLGAAVAVGLPILLLGGRSGADAESSSIERLECWAEGFAMWRENPFLGVGQGQFNEHHYLTAHNSLILTLAELGPAGLLLWSATLYFAFKVTLSAQRELASRPEAMAARSWATALLASLAGLAVSAFFLSIAYHVVLWIYLGMVGALYAAVRRHAPDFRVRFGWRDLAVVGGGDAFLLVAISMYIRIKRI